MPGYGFPTDPPAGDPRLDQVNAHLDQAAALVDPVIRKAVAAAVEPLDQAQAAFNQAEALIRGHIAACIDKAEAGFARASSKVIGRVRSVLGQGYAFAQQVGVPWPTDDQVFAGITTGDYLGALAAPTDPTNGPASGPGGSGVGYDGPRDTPPGPSFPPPASPPSATGPPVFMPQPDAFPPVNGRCPPGYMLQPSDNLCHRVYYDTSGAAQSSGGYVPPAAGDGGLTCPTDYHPEWPAAGPDGSPVDDGSPIDPMRTRGPLGVQAAPQPCDPPIFGGYQSFLANLPAPMAGGGWYVQPWQTVGDVPEPPFSISATIPGCHLRPPDGRPLVLRLPPNFRLFYRPSDGMIIAATQTPPGYVPWEDVTPGVPGGGAGGGPGGGAGGGGPGAPVCAPDVCRTPPVLSCGPTGPVQPPPLPLGQSDVCKGIADSLRTIDAVLPNLGGLLGLGTMAMGSGTIDSVLKWITGSDEPVLPGLVRRFREWLIKTVKTLVDGVDCNRAQMIPIATSQAVLHFIHQWTGIVPAQVLAGLAQVSNTACQSLLPGGDQADAAYLADTISKGLWECWHKAAGNHVKEAEKVMEAKRARLSARDAAILFRRGLIDEKRYRELSRQNGLINDADRVEVETATRYYPTPPDLLRFMVKDVFDRGTIDRFELEAEFTQKFQAEAPEIAKGLGMSVDQVRWHWIAHWAPVGIQTMIQANQRFRPGRVDESLVFSDADLDKALAQQDINPYWRRRIIELSRIRPTRVDLRRMFELHTIKEEELYQRLRDWGYDDADAKLLVRYFQTMRRIAEVKKSGLPTPRTLIMQFARGELSTGDFRAVVQAISYYDEQPEQMMQSAQLARKVYTQTKAIGAIKKRYVRGLMGDGEAAGKLAAAGVETDDIQSFIAVWAIERESHTKEATAERLCKWRSLNLITAGEQQQALIRVGWRADDANRIIAECNADLVAKAEAAARKAEKEAKARAKEEAARQKELARAAANGTNGTAH